MVSAKLVCSCSPAQAHVAHLWHQVGDIDDFVADEALKEDTHQAHKPVLDVLVLRAFT